MTDQRNIYAEVVISAAQAFQAAKFKEKVTKNIRLSRKKRKSDDRKIERDLRIYQNPPKKPRQHQHLNKKIEENIYEEKIFKCDICSKNFKKSYGSLT